MIKDLEELIQYVKRTIPQSKTIQNLKSSEEGDYVSFLWKSRNFLIRKNLQVFEVKSGRVFITGASTLMQSTLVVQNHNQKTIEGIVENLQEAEHMLKGALRKEQGLRVLDGIKRTLARLTGRAVKRQTLATHY